MRILLADDHAEIRSGLRLLLEQEPDLSVAGEAADLEMLLHSTRQVRPDLILLDWELPGLRVPDHLVALRRLRPGLYLIALSGRPESRKAALAAGADAFVSKGDHPERLLATLRAVAAGAASPPREGV